MHLGESLLIGKICMGSKGFICYLNKIFCLMFFLLIVFRNPEEFKIHCLKDLQSIFDGKRPFFAGYGNRPNVSLHS